MNNETNETNESLETKQPLETNGKDSTDLVRSADPSRISPRRVNESDGPLRNIRLTLEFDGTDFYGWQAQTSQRTIQGEMERAIQKVTGESVRVTGCSRTDAGVHARGFIMNFYTSAPIPPEKLRYPLNAVLPPDIRVIDSRAVDTAFHARKQATRKTYSYTMINQEQEPAIGRQYIHREKGKLDLSAMDRCVTLFLGTHDFAAFRSTGSSAKTTTRTIFEVKLEHVGNCHTMTITGDGFLYNMVRIIAGTLLEVGHGSRSVQDVQEALATGDRIKAGKVAPAKGLTLESVEY